MSDTTGAIHQDSRGNTWYLHTKKVELRNGRIQQIYFFAKDERDGRCSMPDGYEVIETRRTGMPVLRKVQ